MLTCNSLFCCVALIKMSFNARWSIAWVTCLWIDLAVSPFSIWYIETTHLPSIPVLYKPKQPELPLLSSLPRNQRKECEKAKHCLPNIWWGDICKKKSNDFCLHYYKYHMAGTWMLFGWKYIYFLSVLPRLCLD